MELIVHYIDIQKEKKKHPTLIDYLKNGKQLLSYQRKILDHIEQNNSSMLMRVARQNGKINAQMELMRRIAENNLRPANIDFFNLDESLPRYLRRSQDRFYEGRTRYQFNREYLSEWVSDAYGDVSPVSYNTGRETQG